ncbi:MAG TPA: glycosyltransferase family A protein [Candidatus Limnocylindria bacterium]|nr:glycosyltransferase family A protein [Candidatus Limnocylindria bacterium]
MPTARRPAFLRTALASIAAQTVAHRITRVVVSENDSDTSSRAIAAEFAHHLPLEYVFRSPSLPNLTHALTLAEELPEDGIMAMLHDDDWWTTTHLADSLARLDNHPDAVASYASFFNVTGESSLLESDSNLMFWFGANFPPVANCWRLDARALLLSCLPGTPGRYSTLVARASAYRHSARVAFAEGNPYDNDRLLTLQFAKLGPIAFAPVPEVFIRIHPAQDANRFDWPQRQLHMTATTERLLAQASPSFQADLLARVNDCPPAALPSLLTCLSQPWCIGPLTGHRIAPRELVAFAKEHGPRSKNFRYYLGQLVPPVFHEVWHRWHKEA